MLKDLHGLTHAEIAEVMDIHQGAARVLLHRARTAFRRAFRSTAPTGAGGITMLGLAAFLPELPVPASLQAPPLPSLVPPAPGPASPPPDLAGPASGGGQTTLSGGGHTAPSGGAPGAAVPIGAAVPVAAVPLAPAGLLAGLGGATGIKVAIAVIATVVATSGGLAARHYADNPTSLYPATNRAATGAAMTPLAVPADHHGRTGSWDASDCDPQASRPRRPRSVAVPRDHAQRHWLGRQRRRSGRPRRRQHQRRRHEGNWRWSSRRQRHGRDRPKPERPERYRERPDRIGRRHGRDRRDGCW